MTKVKEERINITPAETPEIGADVNKTIVSNIIEGAQVGGLDISSIDALSNSAQNREMVYELLDSMAQDDVIASVLETYADDVVQTNDRGQVMWIESTDTNVSNYTTWLLDTLNVDKHARQWAYCLVTYGDCYVRLYRRSDVGNDLLFQNSKHNKRLNEATEKKNTLDEEVVLRLYADDDPYIPYVEMVPNPGEMFDLQKYGKCYGYIQAPIRMVQQTTDELYNYLTRYKMKQRDVEIFDATSFVHACLENTNQRQPETVDIFLDNYEEKLKQDGDIEIDDASIQDAPTTSYSIKRGQSILYNSFRIWRELNLLEMSALLNRLTQSSVVRILNIDVGDMPKEQVEIYLRRLKERIEQKSALETGISMAEYTNAGPIINTIYVPTHGNQGSITANTIGGDFDPKSLVDIEYFRDKLFGSLRVPKHFFGFTEDGAGFNGGSSLTIISSRYGKTVKNIQNILCQMVTDIINLFLIDRGLNNYVNKFTVRMQAPVTQEEIDRRTNTDNRIRYVGDVMQQLSDIDDKAVKLKIYKSLLTNVVNDNEVMTYLQSYIDSLEAKPKEEEITEETEVMVPELEEEIAESEEEKEIITEDGADVDDDYLPTPEELGIKFSDEE